MQAAYNPRMTTEDFGGRFAADLKGLAELRVTARQNPREGLRAAAQQFEALFMQMMLKSMRDATPQDGMFDSDQTRFFTSMFDQQLTQNLSGKGSTGLAQLLEQQLGRGLAPADEAAALQLRPPLAAPTRDPAAPLSPRAPAPTWPAATGGASAPANAAASPAASAAEAANSAASEAENAGPRAFVERIWPQALTASAETGIPAHFLVAHAALESGWGKSEIRRADGSPSFNLFGVKAGRRWSGDTVEANTTEYVGGVATATRESFRAYGSYAEAFRDYATMLRNNPRFSPVIGVTDGTVFARQLQQGGYATDPMYADKLTRILSGQTLRRALQG